LPADRLLWISLSRIWPEWKSALHILKPETVIAWHRKGFRLYWPWKSRRRFGRPPVAAEMRELNRRISVANPGRGAPRIHGELGKLGIKVSETTVAKYMVRVRNSPSRTWRTLTNHIGDLVAVDFFLVPTRHLSIAVCIRNPFPSPPSPSPFRTHQSSDGRGDSATACAGLPLGHGAAFSIAGSGRQLRKHIQ